MKDVKIEWVPTKKNLEISLSHYPCRSINATWSNMVLDTSEIYFSASERLLV
jgi:hypothetical protein